MNKVKGVLGIIIAMSLLTITVRFVVENFIVEKNVENKKMFDLSVPTENVGPIMWREIGANCVKFQNTSYWVLMRFGGFVGQTSLFLHTTNGDSGLITADPVSDIRTNSFKLEYFDESIRDTAAQFENMQTIKAHIFTKTFNNKCFSVVYKIETASLEDQIQFQTHRNSLFKKQPTK